MTDQPHKPAPKIVAVRPLPTDYQTDPTDPFPVPTPAPKRGRKPSAKAVAKSAAKAAEKAAEKATAQTAGSSAARLSAPVGRSSAPVAKSSASATVEVAAVLAAAPPAPLTPQAPLISSSRPSHSRDHKPLRIAHLYPSLLNVAGDGGNLIAIQRRAQWRGIPVDVVAVEKGDSPDFRKFDVILFHGGQDVEMAIVAADFSRKTASLQAATDEGVVVFAVCAGLQLLGHRYVSNEGEEMLGAGILDLETRGGPQRFMQHAACQVTINGITETVVGFENHSGLTTLGPGCEAFGRVTAGAGNNGRDGLEGARTLNVFATYLHGPCLPKNPWLTDQLIRIAVGRAEGIPAGKVALAPLNDDLERRAHDVALSKAMANRGRRTALEPAKLVRGQKIG
jgi:lipid II isoglutaminyl synthase (glutamine-hydrolysing)